MFCIRIAAFSLILSAFMSPALAAEDPAFDFETRNAAGEVVIPAVIPVVYQFVSPGADDASLVLRITTLVANAWFDAIAPYNATAQGVYSDLGRRPQEEHTDANRNVAIMYASYRILNSLLPAQSPVWQNMMLDVGLDPDDNQTSLDNPIGIGNAAGNALVAAREMDGMNQLGNEGGCSFNCQPYANSTGYKPVNTAYELNDPSRWQPAVITSSNGIFRVQQFVTPQYGHTDPYVISDLEQHQVVPPQDSNPDLAAYKQQADEVLEASANLTDAQKMASEFFNDKFESLGFSILFMAQSRLLSLEEFVWLDLATNIAAFDTGIAVWREKARHDAVRPFSAISYLYGDQPVTAWGGPGQGTVSDIPGNQWKGYLNAADHPEYPSATASFCAAHAETMRLAFGTDEMGWTVDIPQGASRVEPGVTPMQDMQLSWDTWTEFETDCGISRFWAGVHFMPAIEVATDLGRSIGERAYEFVINHINGTVD
ncbi:MAG: vanadium-dependent haloperoxidase [Pseudohongiella sp.]|uniref:vanadium-dependent haloperoxidase n=1 Tax=Pseudohongiella sp. TaxID=1979412 RepID=UPI0034A045DC